MSWQDQLHGDSLTWLLESENPGVRYLAERDLVDRPVGEPHSSLLTALEEAHSHGPINDILENINGDGYFAEQGPGYLPKYRSTVWSVIMLAQLGADVDMDERICRACTYLVDHALTDGGHFTSTGSPHGTVDCLQGNLCWALVELGYDDGLMANAFEWLARSVTGEGIAPSSDRSAERRYYAGKCGPFFACGANNRLPCAWGATKVMMALSQVPDEARTLQMYDAVELGLTFLLGTEPATAAYPTGYAKKPSGNWWKFGFPVFYVTDILQIAEAMAALGCIHDPRMENTLELIRGKQDENGRWSLDYSYKGKTWLDFGEKGQPNEWVTLRALRVLKAAGQNSKTFDA